MPPIAWWSKQRLMRARKWGSEASGILLNIFSHSTLAAEAGVVSRVTSATFRSSLSRAEDSCSTTLFPLSVEGGGAVFVGFTVRALLVVLPSVSGFEVWARLLIALLITTTPTTWRGGTSKGVTPMPSSELLLVDSLKKSI